MRVESDKDIECIMLMLWRPSPKEMTWIDSWWVQNGSPKNGLHDTRKIAYLFTISKMAGNHFVIFLKKKFHQFQFLMTIDSMIKEAIQKHVDYSWKPNLFKIVMQLSRKVLDWTLMNHESWFVIHWKSWNTFMIRHIYDKIFLKRLKKEERAHIHENLN